MGHVGHGSFLDSSTVRVIGPEPYVALDLVFFKHQGKRQLIAVQS
jgi:hypothetical protein